MIKRKRRHRCQDRGAAKLLAPGSEALEAQQPVGLQEAVVPEHDQLPCGQLLDSLDDELADVDEVATAERER